MGKRLRSVGVRFGENDIRLTRHAIQRYRERIERIPVSHVPRVVRGILETARPVSREDGNAGRLYLDHDKCVIVMKRNGIVITVLRPRAHSMTSSIKAARKKKKLRRKYQTNSRLHRRPRDE